MITYIKYILIAFWVFAIPPAFLRAQDTLQESVIIDDSFRRAPAETRKEDLSLQRIEQPSPNQSAKGKEAETRGSISEITPVEAPRGSQTKNTNFSPGSQVSDSRGIIDVPAASGFAVHTSPATQNTGAAEPSLVVPFEKEKPAAPPAQASPLTMDDASLKNFPGSSATGAAEPPLAVFDRERPASSLTQRNPVTMGDASLKKPVGSSGESDKAAYRGDKTAAIPVGRSSLARAIKEISGNEDDTGEDKPFYADPAAQAGAGIAAIIILMLGVLFKFRRLIVITKK